jgi:hypothetical protein
LEKLLLIIDNESSHLLSKLLEHEGGTFKVMFLSPNITSLLQPMDCVTETLKRLHTKQLLRRLLLSTDNEENVSHFCKGLGLKSAVTCWQMLGMVSRVTL